MYADVLGVTCHQLHYRTVCFCMCVGVCVCALEQTWVWMAHAKHVQKPDW